MLRRCASLAFALALASVAGGGCAPRSDGDPSRGGDPVTGGDEQKPPRVEVTPNPVRFATVRPGYTSSQLVTLLNIHPDSATTIRRLTIVGDASGAFTIVPPLTQSVSVATGDALDIELRFSPPVSGDYAALLRVDTDGAPDLDVSLAGTSPAGGLATTPGTADLGVVSVGVPSDLEVSITNLSGAARTLSSISVLDGANGQISIAAAPSLPMSLADGQSTPFTVRVQATAEGDLAGWISIRSDDPDVPDLRVRVLASVSPAPPPPNEFLVNRTRRVDQRRPDVAALPQRATNGAVAVVIFEDNSDLGNANESGHQHYATAAVDENKNSVGSFDSPHIMHHTEGIGYVGIAADTALGRFSAAGRWHPPVDSSALYHPRSLFLHTIRGTGGDDGGKLLNPPDDRLPSNQSVTTTDVAADPAGPRFVVCRVSGAPTTTTALPEGLIGRVTNRTGTVMLTDFFRLSAVTSTAQRNPRVAFAAGRYLVTWEDAGRIFGRLFSAGAPYAPIGVDFLISEPGVGSARNARIAANPSTGVFLVAWNEAEIRARTVSPDGLLSAAIQVNGVTTGAQEKPAVACDPATGAWMVAWTGPDASMRGIWGRKLAADLTPGGDEFQVNEVVDGDQQDAGVAWAPVAGKWLFVWTGQDTDGLGIKGRFVP